MHLFLTTLALLTQLIGQISYYDYPMQEVYKLRLQWNQVEPCPKCVGMLAVENTELLGYHGYIKLPNGKIIGPVLVVDVGEFITPNRIAEINYELAMKLGMNGPLENIRIFFTKNHKSK